MKKILIKIISFYQKYISLDTGILYRYGIVSKKICHMYPTCSEYVKQSVEKYGVAKGTYLGLRRIFKCHPWQKDLFDPIK